MIYNNNLGENNKIKELEELNIKLKQRIEALEEELNNNNNSNLIMNKRFNYLKKELDDIIVNVREIETLYKSKLKPKDIYLINSLNYLKK